MANTWSERLYTVKESPFPDKGVGWMNRNRCPSEGMNHVNKVDE